MGDDDGLSKCRIQFDAMSYNFFVSSDLLIFSLVRFAHS